ncbi:upstream-binding factor 1-like protein 1 [Eptesicus fuscus]|uniref:upstream-binding factor 1-like protein 1 n=1 Tax=Eptesicus fuscus TaxID=29078 RepID=UPI0024045532|nr:upstream-binding factor 1-like protein 1 [Eptesicus fuscus]
MALNNVQGQWPKEDIVMLLDLLKNNLPSNDKHSFKTTQSHMDWGKVAFKGYSAEMCKLKWLEISRKIRKYRTLTELVLEAKEHVKNSNKSKKLKKHPDMPKQPLTPYLRFFKKNRLEYSQMYPKLNNQELTKVMSEKYKELPEERRRKYIEDFQKEKQEFQEKLAQFRKDHPDLVQNSKTSVIPKGSPSRAHRKFRGNGKELNSSPENDFPKTIKFRGEPKKPPMNEYQKFHQDLWSSRELQGLPLRERMVEISRRWQRVPRSQREHYKQQAEELQKQYKVDLEHWLKSLSPEEYAAYRERASGKRKIMNMRGGPDPKIIRTHVQSPSARTRQEGLAQNQGQAPGMASSETNGDQSHASWGSEGKKEHEKEAESSSSSDSSSSDEDDSSCSSSSSGDTSDSDSN